MDVLNIPFLVVGAVVTLTVLSWIARRLLGVPFSLTRMVVAALISWACAKPFLTGLVGNLRPNGQPYATPPVTLELLAFLCILLPGMVFLVVAEALAPSGSLPRPAVMVKDLYDRLARSRRYWAFVLILVRHGLGPHLRGARPRGLSAQDKQAALGRSMRDALNEGGLTFVKFGQILSTRRDLLPAGIVDELATLQHQAARVPWPDVQQVLTEEFGDLGTVFSRLDQEPLAAASVAQVHTARLVSGQEVVVKVRRPRVTSVVERDLDILKRLALRLEQRTDWARRLGTISLADGFATALREELDLRIEARNLAAVPQTAEVAVPRAFPEFSSERILVMEYFDGVPLSEAGPVAAERGIEPADLAGTLLGYILRQIMVDGVFHADPHPGNILLLPDDRLGMIDFGSVGRLNAATRAGLQRLLLAVDAGNPLHLTDAVLEVMVAPEGLDQAALERDLGRFMARYLGADSALDVAMFTDLFRIVTASGLAVPPEVAGVFRALGTLEGTLARLSPGFDVIAEARGLAAGYAAEKLTPDAVRKEVTGDLAALLPMLRRLPHRIDRIADALETGSLSVNVRLLADHRDRDTITGWLHLVLLTALAATSGIMSVQILGRPGGPRVSPTVSLYQFLGYSLLVVTSILALRVMVVVFRRPEARRGPP